jgi:hypothetical protein
MAYAMIYPEPEKGGREKKSKNSTETLGFSAMRLSQARTVLSHSRDVAMEILAGTKFLDKEYATARKRTVQSDAVRGKKVPVVPDKCALDALSAPSAHDPEDPKLGNETEKIGLAMQDLDRLATFKRRTLDPEAIWICEQLELAWQALRGHTTAGRGQ